MAEADIAEGRPKNALSQYAQTLKLAPESTRAILSLAMLADETGDRAKAGGLLRARAEEPLLRSAGAARRGRLVRLHAGTIRAAEKHAQIALSLKPGLDRAKILLGGHLPADRPLHGRDHHAPGRGDGQP